MTGHRLIDMSCVGSCIRLFLLDVVVDILHRVIRRGIAARPTTRTRITLA